MPRDDARIAELHAHRALRRDKACTGKVAFPTLNDAKHAAKKVEKKHERKAYAYKCVFAPRGQPHWHISTLRHGEAA